MGLQDLEIELSCQIDFVKKQKINKWDIKPTQEYFDELFRVSKNQIIWGANNFTLPNTEYFIIWDKQQTVDNFASAEYAWTNCKMPAKVFRYSIHKVMSDGKAEGGKIHPTQKPIALSQMQNPQNSSPGVKYLHSLHSSMLCLLIWFR